MSSLKWGRELVCLSLCGNLWLCEGSWCACGLKFMWERAAEWRGMVCLRVHMGAGGCVKGAVLFEAWSSFGSWRLCEVSWCASDLSLTFLTLTWPSPDLPDLHLTFLTLTWPSTDLDLDLSLTKIVNEDKAVVVILFKDVELILALLWLKVNGLMLTVDSKMVFMEGKKNFKLILPKL